MNGDKGVLHSEQLKRQIGKENNASSKLGRKSKTKPKVRIRNCPLETGERHNYVIVFDNKFPHVELLSDLASLSTAWLIPANNDRLFIRMLQIINRSPAGFSSTDQPESTL